MRSYFVLSLQLNISRMKRLRCLVFLTHSLIDFVVQVFWTPDKKRKKLIAQAKKAKSKRFKGENEKKSKLK